MLCRDRCGYCTFAQPPARLESPYLTPRAGARASPGRAPPAGCHEALFTLGEAPEERYPVAARVAGRARLRVDRRLPGGHVPARARRDRPAPPRQRRRARPATSSSALRAVAAEPGDDGRDRSATTSTATAARPTRCPPAAWPPSRPPARPASRSPPGSSSASARTRPTASTRSRPSPTSHRRHGHVQEVIVQNFLPKAGTAMHAAPPCPPDDYLEAIAPGPADPAARGPPAGAAEPVRRLRRAARRRHRRLGRRLPRHRRPREPRAALAGARPPARGHRGRAASRWRRGSPSTPSSCSTPSAGSHPDLRFRGARPQRRRGPRPRRSRRRVPRADRGRGRGRRRRRGRADRPPLHRLVLRRAARARACSSPPPAATAGTARSARCSTACCSARRSARTRSSRCSPPAAPRSPPWPRWPTSCAGPSVGDAVTYVRNRNINYTNVCTFKCRFCGFSKGPLSLNLRGTPVPAHPRGHRRAGCVEAVGRGRHRGVPAGRHPPRLRRRLLHRRRPGRERGGARDPHPRLHRARGHRGRQAPRRAAGRLPAPAAGRRPPDPARHRRRDPRRRGPRRSCARTRSTPRSGSRPTAPPTRSACARTSRSCSARSSSPAPGPATSCAPATCRRRPAASPSSCRCRSCTWRRRSTSSTRPGAGPTFREALLMHAVGRIAYRGLDRQHPGVVGEARPRRRRARCCRPASTTSAAR